METLSIINFLMAALFTVCYCYQAVFALVRLLGKRRTFTAKKLCLRPLSVFSSGRKAFHCPNRSLDDPLLSRR